MVCYFLLLVLYWLCQEYLKICVVFLIFIQIINFIKCEVDIVVCIVCLDVLDLIVCYFKWLYIGMYVLKVYVKKCGLFDFGMGFKGYDVVIYLCSVLFSKFEQICGEFIIYVSVVMEVSIGLVMYDSL